MAVKAPPRGTSNAEMGRQNGAPSHFGLVVSKKRAVSFKAAPMPADTRAAQCPALVWRAHTSHVIKETGRRAGAPFLCVL